MTGLVIRLFLIVALGAGAYVTLPEAWRGM